MEKKVKLTTVNVLDDVYKKFKVTSVEEPINLQKLVNRCLDLYNCDADFREKINTHSNLGHSGSKF
jgi:hypothetical protein